MWLNDKLVPELETYTFLFFSSYRNDKQSVICPHKKTDHKILCDQLVNQSPQPFCMPYLYRASLIRSKQRVNSILPGKSPSILIQIRRDLRSKSSDVIHYFRYTIPFSAQS